MVFFQLGYNREHYDQTIGRVGSARARKEQVRVWRIICEKTIDIDIKNALYGKQHNQGEFLEVLGNFAIKRG